MTLRTLNYGNYGIFHIMGNAGFCPSTVWALSEGTWGGAGQVSDLRFEAWLRVPMGSCQN